jgi:adenine deaminase
MLLDGPDRVASIDGASARPDRLVRAARGEVAFDLLLKGGTMADVAAGELWDANAGIVGGFIASVP